MNWGILATGTIANKFATTVNAMAAEGERLAAVGSRRAESAKAFAAQYNIPHWYASYEELAADPAVDAIYIATPNALHYENCKLCLEHGKHVYTEKVLCVQPEQARELAALAKEKGLLLCAAPDTFLGAGIQTARAIVDSGIVGDITSCVAVLQRDAGLLAEKFPYTIAQGGGIGIDAAVMVYDSPKWPREVKKCVRLG